MESRLNPSELIEQAQQFFTLGARVQNGLLDLNADERKELVEELGELYRPWYRQALGVFASYGRPDLQKAFMRDFEGALFYQAIKRFLEAGWQPYRYYDPAKPDPILPKWTVTYKRSFEVPLDRQCDLLAALTSK